jgi:LysR family glycine cleavage system transcriptional activator
MNKKRGPDSRQVPSVTNVDRRTRDHKRVRPRFDMSSSRPLHSAGRHGEMHGLSIVDGPAIMPARDKNRTENTATARQPRLKGMVGHATLPGSAVLRAFESAGRHLSFKRAAQELKVTESAISFQIRRLERDLGSELFERGHRQIALTPGGRAYLRVVQQAHRDIADATVSLSGQARQVVRISLVPALAEHWLVPRLGRLREALPDIAVTVLTSNDLADLDRDEIDIAIRYGTGSWPRTRIEPLMDEFVMPVAHRNIARKLRSRSVAMAVEVPLILNLQHPEEWSSWLTAQGDQPRLDDSRDLLRLESSSLVLRAAVEQLGIAIGRRPFVDDFLARGDLVPVMREERPSGKGYFILTPMGRRSLRTEIAAVASFLRSSV